MAFVEIFGGTVIYPSQTSYLALDMSGDVELAWPIEQQIGGDIVADIIDVTASTPGLTITIPDARQVSTGFTSLFNNVGAQTVTILNAAGGTIVSLVSGSAWEIYLTDNSTEAGVWRTFQYGASVSVADAAALAGSGLKAILTTLNQSMPVANKSTDYVILDSDRARAIVWTAGAGTFTLPAAGTVGADWFVICKNLGSGDLTIQPPSGTIDGAASLTLSAGGSAFIDCDGTNYFTVGLGSGGGGSDFDFIEIDVSGAGNYVLSGVELNRIGYRFIGTLSGQRDIIVPAAIQQYWVTNDTSGAFSLFIRTATQTPGIEVLQGDSNILYCDGTDVVSAESSTVSFPIAVNQGGTGATTAANARTNLGATTVGSNVFTAATAADARTAIGAAAAALTLTAGTGLTGGGDLSANRSFALDTSNTRNVDHAAVTLTAGTGMTGGGDITTNRTFNVDQSFNFAFTGTVTYAGNEIGFRGVPGNLQQTDYTLVAADAGKLIYATSSGGSNTWTIPANTSVGFAVGTVLNFANRSGVNKSIAITTDTMYLAGAGSTGTRTLSDYGMATAVKIASSTWLISGIGLT